MSLRFIVTLAFFNTIILFSQESTKKHTIVKGETISSIAEKYDVKQSEIFKLNPKAKNLLKLNSIVLIPISAAKNTNSKTKIAINNSQKQHEVLAKETLYGIARQYGITLKELNEANPTLGSSGLKIGQKIDIPVNASSTEIAVLLPSKKASAKIEIDAVSPESETVSETSEKFSREVLPKETKYSITKQYGITIREFDKANPTIGVKSLRVGQKINIPGNGSVATEMAVVARQSKEETKEQLVVIPNEAAVVSKIEAATVQPKNDLLKIDLVVIPQPNGMNSIPELIVREVLPKETKYGIAKQYGMTVQELEKQNPEIKNSLPVGYRLNIRKDDSSNNHLALNTENRDEASGNYHFKNTISDSNNVETEKFSRPTFSNEFLDQLIARASENIGSRYRTGGTSKAGFDCSGLMCTTFEAFDIKLPRTSREQSDYGTRINTEEAQKGDLIFFKTNGRSQINHVGMVVEVCEGEIKFIHSSVSNGVIISSTKEKYYEKNFTQINRVVQ
ncbi:LysM peptidoglycan-binding domain-containing protein [Flavobacterium sp. XS2P39]|uniref:LysM peptidoglycan-binding domain-containing protein n=1 Tax=Flavobacterium sp. XS2P39 TaxID=3401725 RepID=UPI003AAEE0B6